jgi:hypothetical protein
MINSTNVMNYIMCTYSVGICTVQPIGKAVRNNLSALPVNVKLVKNNQTVVSVQTNVTVVKNI